MFRLERKKGVSLLYILITMFIITVALTEFLFFIKNKSEINRLKINKENTISKKLFIEQEKKYAHNFSKKEINYGKKTFKINYNDYFNSAIVKTQDEDEILEKIYFLKNTKSISGFEIFEIKDKKKVKYNIPLAKNILYPPLIIKYKKKILDIEIIYVENIEMNVEENMELKIINNYFERE